jgi:hypothetical protein
MNKNYKKIIYLALSMGLGTDPTVIHFYKV